MTTRDACQNSPPNESKSADDPANQIGPRHSIRALPPVPIAGRATLRAGIPIGARVRRWILATYPRPRTKRVARDFDVTVDAVYRWMSGACPSEEVFVRMALKWGMPFLRHVFAEVALEDDARWRALEADLAAAKARVAALEVLLAQPGGASAAEDATQVALALARPNNPVAILRRRLGDLTATFGAAPGWRGRAAAGWRFFWAVTLYRLTGRAFG